jgi:hypothetical protein
VAKGHQLAQHQPTNLLRTPLRARTLPAVADYSIAGDTGMIGSELCWQLLHADPQRQLNVAVCSGANTERTQRFVDEHRLQLRQWDARSDAGWVDLIGAHSVIVSLCGEHLGSSPLGSTSVRRRWGRGTSSAARSAMRSTAQP